MSVTGEFDNWYNRLTTSQQRELLNHIVGKHLQSCNEGFFAVPSIEKRGLFAGPSGTAQNKCPLCGR